MIQLKTDYIIGDTYDADDHNNENVVTTGNRQGMIISGKKIDKDIFGIASFTDGDVFPMYSDDINTIAIIENQGDSFTLIDWTNGTRQSRDVDLDWATTDTIRGVAILGVYVYLLLADASQNHRVYRYSRSNISTGGTLMTTSFFTNNYLSEMTSDGVDLFFSNQAGGQRFGDATTQIDVTDQGGGTFRYTYDGTGTAPLFVTNGLVIGDLIEIAGFSNPINNNGLFEVTAVTETYYEVLNPVGSELIVNGDFSSSSNWTFGGWTYDTINNEADFSGTPIFSADLINLLDFSLISGKEYNVNFEIKNRTSGSVRAVLGTSAGTWRSANGTSLETIIASSSTTAKVQTQSSGLHNLSVDNVTVKYAGGQPTTNATGITIKKGKQTITKATISGTTISKDSDISCDNGIISSFQDSLGVDENYIYGYNQDEQKIYKFNNTTGIFESSMDFIKTSGKTINIINAIGDLLLFSEELNFQKLPNL